MSENPQAVMKAGSKSFSLASQFFSQELRVGAANIYHWCRHCDDSIDEGESDKDEILVRLEDETLNVWNNIRPIEPGPYLSLRNAVQRHGIPSFYALELLQGMKMDVHNLRYESLKDLELYCYRVAGTVGLMMTHAMGLFDQEALKMAASMGMAMQLTNISRDIKEDYERERIYLPLNLLKDEGILLERLLEPEFRPHMMRVLEKVLGQAEKYYEEGSKGLIWLPWRAALAVNIAHHIYREIGREILRKGEAALDSRTVIPASRKIILVIKASWEIMLTIPARMFKRREKVVIDQIWRPV